MHGRAGSGQLGQLQPLIAGMGIVEALHSGLPHGSAGGVDEGITVWGRLLSCLWQHVTFWAALRPAAAVLCVQPAFSCCPLCAFPTWVALGGLLCCCLSVLLLASGCVDTLLCVTGVAAQLVSLNVYGLCMWARQVVWQGEKYSCTAYMAGEESCHDSTQCLLPVMYG